MEILTLQNSYTFYKMSEDERKALIGKAFIEERSTKGKYADYSPTLYFPIQLTEECGWMNYGKPQGLIFVSPVWDIGDKSPWFRCAVSSPDDLDMDLDFEKEKIALPLNVVRNGVIAYMNEFVSKPHKVHYIDLLKEIQFWYGGQLN